MDAVEEDFFVEGAAPGFSLRGGDGGADEDFAVVEGDDVGRRGVVEKFGVDAPDFFGREEGELDVSGEGKGCFPAFPLFGQETEGRLKPPYELPRRQPVFALEVEDCQLGRGRGRGPGTRFSILSWIHVSGS